MELKLSFVKINETREPRETVEYTFIHNDLSYKIIGAAIEVHKVLGGPGLLEFGNKQVKSRTQNIISQIESI